MHSVVRHPSVAVTPPCSATPFRRQLDVRHPWQLKGDRCDKVFYGGCSATPLLHLETQDFEESAATRVARQGVPAHVCNYGEGPAVQGHANVEKPRPGENPLVLPFVEMALQTKEIIFEFLLKP